MGHPAGPVPFGNPPPPGHPAGPAQSSIPAWPGATYGIPEGSSVREEATTRFVRPPHRPDHVGGGYGVMQGAPDVPQGSPFDVTLSQLATAVYGTRGGPPSGWHAITDVDPATGHTRLEKYLEDSGRLVDANGARITDRGQIDQKVEAWTSEYLGFTDPSKLEDNNPHEYLAQVYTDDAGNFVLSYRGTAEKGPDWKNNIQQALGIETDPLPDKFSHVAINTAEEFVDVFGDQDGQSIDAGTGVSRGLGADSTNLAMTGHSQGGGLASIAAVYSGVPAVTFAGSGPHPVTLSRLGITPSEARAEAEGGLIRNYSLEADPVTRAQQESLTGLVAPDALGTLIMVPTASEDRNHMFTNYGPMELGGPDGMSDAGIGRLNAFVEAARSPTSFFFPLAGPDLYRAGNLGYSLINHSPNALTNGMIEHRPWEAGHLNKPAMGRDIQDAIPDVAKDAFAIATHNLATGKTRPIVGVVPLSGW